MADAILARLQGGDKLGLVFPDDPIVVGWTNNRKIAQQWAGRLGLDEIPGRHFNFPVGTMFWARSEILEPLVALGLGWDDYPAEPLAHDGTMLHAIERLLPSIACMGGYRYAMTHVPGMSR
jgi:lipopolysaccharide biosynthesis protein